MRWRTDLPDRNAINQFLSIEDARSFTNLSMALNLGHDTLAAEFDLKFGVYVDEDHHERVEDIDGPAG